MTPSSTATPTFTPTIPFCPTLMVQPTATATEDSQAGIELYTVQPGDNLFRIAIRFNTTVDAIAAENNIVNRDNIRVGQVLRIPVPVTPTPTLVATFTPTPNETSLPDSLMSGCVTVTPTATPTEFVTTMYYIKTGSARVRSCPMLTCTILDVYSYGTAIEVIETQNGWHMIILSGGERGHISATLTSETIPPTPIVQQPNLTNQTVASQTPQPTHTQALIATATATLPSPAQSTATAIPPLPVQPTATWTTDPNPNETETPSTRIISVQASPGTVAAGSTIAIRLSGFAANDRLDLTIGSQASLAIVDANGSGCTVYTLGTDLANGTINIRADGRSDDAIASTAIVIDNSKSPESASC